MNHIYRLVWSHVLAAWVAIAESGSGRGKSSSRKLKFVIAPSLTLYAALTPAAPLDGLVVSGVGHIATSGATTTIQQATQNLSLSWKSFDVAAHETVNFVQPSTAAIAVNRIADINGSQILGNVNANGQVYFINPNGILFGQDAQVDVGSLVASTLDINDASLGSNARLFSGTGAGNIVNQGNIQTTEGGYVALLGQTVSNQGIINAPKGAVVLGGASAATLTFQDHSLVSMQVDESVLNTLAENGGLVKANGGMVIMNAGAKNTLLASVVNNTGVIEARTVENREGSIVILGGMAAGTANISGTLDASAPDGGNGGFIETSAANVKIQDDVLITTAALPGTNSKSGTWLIDPTDFNINAGAGASTVNGIGADTLSTSLGTGNVTIATSANGTELGDINVNSAVSWSANKLTLTAYNDININAVMTASGSSTLALNPASGNVNVGMNAVGFTGRVDFTSSSGVGFLTVNSAPYTLVNSIADLRTMGGTGNYALGSSLNFATEPDFTAGHNFAPIATFADKFNGLGHTITGMKISIAAANMGMFKVAGTVSDIRNIGLIGGSVSGAAGSGGLIGSGTTGNVANSYNTGSVRGAAGTGGLVGSMTTGSISNSFTTGAVTGEAGTGGLVGTITSGGISKSYAIGDVIGHAGTGGLVGDITTGAISESYATGDVSGAAGSGGLAGTATTGSISNAYASGNVLGTTATGGLVGSTTGSVTYTYASGSVTGTSPGGLLGTKSASTVLKNNFWNLASDDHAVGDIAGTASDGATGISLANLQATDFVSASYVDSNNHWDFVSKWQLVADATPILRGTLPKLTVTSIDNISVYSGQAFLLAPSGLTFSSELSATDLTYLSGQRLTNTAASATATNVGAYAIDGRYLSQTRYNISYVAGTHTITPKTVTLSASKVYDGFTSLDGFVSIATGVGSENLAYSGAVANDAHVLTGTSIGAITLIDGSGGLASNYVLPTLDAANAAVTITPAPLTASATITGAHKVYDGFVAASTSSIDFSAVTGLLSGDAAALDTSGILLAFSNAHVTGASNTISASGSAAISITSGNSGNGVSGQVESSNTDYAFTLALPIDVVGQTITAKQLTATATINGVDKPYDGLLVATGSTFGNTAIAGALDGDSITMSTSGLSLSFDNAHAGARTVTASGTALIGGVATTNVGDGSAGNRVAGVASDYASSAVFTIAPVFRNITPIVLTASAVISGSDKIYDGLLTAANSSITGTTSGSINGDSVAFDTSGYSLAFYDPNVAYVSNGIKATGTAVLGSISNSTAAGDGITSAVHGITSDYIITAQPSIADVSKSVTERALTVAAVAADKVFDGSDTAAVTLSDNRVTGDALTILNSAAKFADASVGSKLVYVSGITVTGADASNYTFNTLATTVAASISALPTPAVSTDTVVITDSPADLAHSGEGQRQITAKSKTENGGVCNGSSVSQVVGCGAGFSAVFPLASADITAALSGTYDR
jgi:filamentous hemagglutinin family protein